MLKKTNKKYTALSCKKRRSLLKGYKPHKVLCTLIAVLYLSIPLFSETKTVSLERCLDIAMQNHPDLKASYEERKEAIAEYRAARALSKPQVNLEIKTVEYLKEGTSSNNVITIPGKDTVIGLFAGPTIMFNLIDPRKTDIEDARRLEIDISKMKTIKTREDIICNVKKGYYSYSSSRETRKLMAELVEKFKIKLDRAKLLFKSGQRPILDVTKAEVDHANARLEYEKAVNNEMLAKTKLLSDMGIMDTDIEFVPMQIEKLPRLRFDLPALNKLAGEYYPEIKIAEIRKELSRISIEAARSNNWPSVDFLASMGFENTNMHGWRTKEDLRDKVEGDNWSLSSHFGIRAKMPIDFLSGGGISAKVDAAIAVYNRMSYAERKVLVKMRGFIRTYYQSMNELLKQIEISVPIIDNANKHLMLARKSYESGISTQLDMQDAEMAVLEAKLNLLKAKYDYLISLANLSNVIGLGEEYLCEKE